MKPRFWSFGVVAPLMGAMLVTIGACNRENKKQPAEDQAQGDTNQVKVVEKKWEWHREVVAAQAQPSARDAASQKTPDKNPVQAVDLGRSSVTQAEEPAVRTPDLRGWDPLGADCAWFREFKRDISAD